MAGLCDRHTSRKNKTGDERPAPLRSRHHQGDNPIPIRPFRIKVGARRLTLLGLLLASACGTLGTRAAPVRLAPDHPEGSGGRNHPIHDGKPVVVVLSIDGFRADYLDDLPTPALRTLASEGVRAAALIPGFPTLTFPSHYTIATGLTAEQHGVVANRMYDRSSRHWYSPADSTVREGRWYRGEPLWVTAERQGMVTAIRYWPGSEAEILGVRPSYWKAYDAREPTRSRLEQVLDWLELPEAERPHLVFAYLDVVDVAGHAAGPGSPEVAAAVDSVDRAIGEFLRALDASSVANRVFLIVLSDHGMAPFTPDRHVALEDLADTTGVQGAQYGPVSNLFVSGGAPHARRLRDELNRGLRNGRAYLRENLPARLGYSADPRAGDVVVLMEEGFIFGRKRFEPSSPGGAHGWDPRYPSMHGLFLIRGPGIPAGGRIPALESVRIARMIAEILELPAPQDAAGSPEELLTSIRRAARNSDPQKRPG